MSALRQTYISLTRTVHFIRFYTANFTDFFLFLLTGSERLRDTFQENLLYGRHVVGKWYLDILWELFRSR